MNRAGFFVIFFLLFGNAGLTLAGAPERESDKATVESYQKAIRASKDESIKAQLHKKLGDLYASREDFKNAAEEYIRAFPLEKKFSIQERLKMGIAISWGDRLDEAIAVFQSILKDDPNNSEARIHLAQTLSWAGKFDESLAEIEPVLDEDPENRDALLIKANDLRWKGETDEALPLYRSILEKQEDFDARIGYTAVLFARGEKEAARESMALLKPLYPYQEKELQKLQESLRTHAPHAQQGEVRFSHYRDTDGNYVNKYGASYGLTAGAWKSLFNFVHTEAQDNLRSNSTDLLSGETRVQVGRLGVGAGLGVIRYQNADTDDFLLGHLKADFELPWGSAGVALAWEPLNETAELISKEIRFTAARAYLSRSVTDRLFFYGGFGYTDYSDNNDSRNLYLALRYSLVQEDPRINIGYRFRYLDFDHQSFDGYFDPNHFLSHQIFVNTSVTRGKISALAELFVGYQSYDRYGIGHSEIVTGGSVTIGYKLTKNISVGLNGEGGDYALQTAAGFRYHLFGVRLNGEW